MKPETEPQQPPKLLNLRQCAALTNTTPESVQAWIDRGELTPAGRYRPGVAPHTDLLLEHDAVVATWRRLTAEAKAKAKAKGAGDDS